MEFDLSINSITHRYGNNPSLFQNLDLDICFGNSLAILGKNGSGKSTLIKIMAKTVSPTRGKVKYSKNIINTVLVSPYMNLYDELTLSEHHSLISLAPFQNDEAAYWDLSLAMNKPLGNFSSGMKQRAKYYLASVALKDKGNLILLDEPHANLDLQGIALVKDKIEQWASKQNILVIASNDENEYSGIDWRIVL